MNINLINDLCALGIKQGDTILMHSSLKSLGGSISPKEVIDSILHILGENGTLILPSFSYIDVNDENPYFNVKTSPSCVGAIPEYFRLNYNVVRSLHPTHSLCAIGKNATKITSNHQKDNTPVGKNSPISRLEEFDGKILMLGCGLNPSTFMHGAEETAKASYCLKNDSKIYYIKDYFNNTIEMDYTRHNFKNIAQKYCRLEDILPKDLLKKSKVLNSTSYLFEHKKVLDIAINKLIQDPLFFVDSL